jgi:hypothetical protein
MTSPSSSTPPVITETVEDLVRTIKQMLDKLVVDVEAVGCGRSTPLSQLQPKKQQGECSK